MHLLHTPIIFFRSRAYEVLSSGQGAREGWTLARLYDPAYSSGHRDFWVPLAVRAVPVEYQPGDGKLDCTFF